MSNFSTALAIKACSGKDHVTDLTPDDLQKSEIYKMWLSGGGLRSESFSSLSVSGIGSVAKMRYFYFDRA